MRGIIREMKWAPIKGYRISFKHDIVQHIEIIDNTFEKLEKEWYVVTNGMKIRLILRSLLYEWSEVLWRSYESNKSLHYYKIITIFKAKYEENRFFIKVAIWTAILSMSPNLHSEKCTIFEKLDRGLLTH